MGEHTEIDRIFRGVAVGVAVGAAVCREAPVIPSGTSSVSRYPSAIHLDCWQAGFFPSLFSWIPFKPRRKKKSTVRHFVTSSWELMWSYHINKAKRALSRAC